MLSDHSWAELVICIVRGDVSKRPYGNKTSFSENKNVYLLNEQASEQ